MCYPDPWNSSVGDQLDPAGREPVCAQLNSAILGNIKNVFCHPRHKGDFVRIKKFARAASAGNLRSSHLTAPQADVTQLPGGVRLCQYG